MHSNLKKNLKVVCDMPFHIPHDYSYNGLYIISTIWHWPISQGHTSNFNCDMVKIQMLHKITLQSGAVFITCFNHFVWKSRCLGWWRWRWPQDNIYLLLARLMLNLGHICWNSPRRWPKWQFGGHNLVGPGPVHSQSPGWISVLPCRQIPVEIQDKS